MSPNGRILFGAISEIMYWKIKLFSHCNDFAFRKNIIAQKV